MKIKPNFLTILIFSRNRPPNQGIGKTRAGEFIQNAMEVNKIAQCSKMVPAMFGTSSEIRAALEAVNWDTSVTVKNLNIVKLYRVFKA